MVEEKSNQKSVPKAQKIKEKKIKNNRKQIFVVWCLAVLVILLMVVFANIQKDPVEDIISEKVYGDDIIEMSYFHWTRCSHCIHQNDYNNYLKAKYPNLKIIEYEISNQSVMDVYVELASQIEGLDAENFPGTPLTIFENTLEFNVGYGGDDSTGKKLSSIIEAINEQIDENWDDETMNRTVNPLTK